MLMNAAVNMSGWLYHQVLRVIEFFTWRKEKKTSVLGNPLVIFIVVLAVIFITWAAVKGSLERQSLSAD